MHILRHLVPFDIETCAVGAEYGIGRIFGVAVTVVANGGNDLVGVVTFTVAAHDTGQSAVAVGVADDFVHVASQFGNRAASLYHGHFPYSFGRIKFRRHMLKIGDSTSHILRGDFQFVVIPRL